MQSMSIWQHCNSLCLDSALLCLCSIMLQFLKEGVVQSSLWLSISIQVGRDVYEWPQSSETQFFFITIEHLSWNSGALLLPIWESPRLMEGSYCPILILSNIKFEEFFLFSSPFIFVNKKQCSRTSIWCSQTLQSFVLNH